MWQQDCTRKPLQTGKRLVSKFDYVVIHFFSFFIQHYFENGDTFYPNECGRLSTSQRFAVDNLLSWPLQ